MACDADHLAGRDLMVHSQVTCVRTGQKLDDRSRFPHRNVPRLLMGGGARSCTDRKETKPRSKYLKKSLPRTVAACQRVPVIA